MSVLTLSGWVGLGWLGSSRLCPGGEGRNFGLRKTELMIREIDFFDENDYVRNT